MNEPTHMDLYIAKDLIRELNAKGLKKAWRKHLKRQAKNNERKK
jgi:hypothetical protein